MNKYLITSLMICFYFTFQYPGYSKPAEPQVKGGFRSCTATEYRYKSGKIDQKTGQKSSTVIFDEKGNQIELISYEENKISQKYKIENKY